MNNTRLTREQIDELLPFYSQTLLAAGGLQASPHMLLFAVSAFVGAFELDSVQLSQVQKAASIDSPVEIDATYLQNLNKLISGDIYMNPSQLTHFYGRAAFAYAAKAGFEAIAKAAGLPIGEASSEADSSDEAGGE